MKKNFLKTRWFQWGFFALLGLIAVFFFFFRAKEVPVSYQEFKVHRGSLQVIIQSTGTVQPKNRLDIKPPVAGRVEEILVKEGEKVKKGQILAWMSSTERAALLDAARSDGPEAVQRWERDFKPTPVIAPIDGTLILRNVETGQTFTNADSIFTMSDRLTIKATVDETDIGAIKLGQEASVTLDAFPDQEIPAKVDQIAFDATTTNNVTTYLVDVLPDKTPKFMRSGMTANVNFKVQTKEEVLMIPSQLLQSGNFVYVRTENGGAEQRDIHVGISNGPEIEVTEGLSDGETVLLPVQGQGLSAGEKSNPFSPFGGRRGRKK